MKWHFPSIHSEAIIRKIIQKNYSKLHVFTKRRFKWVVIFCLHRNKSSGNTLWAVYNMRALFKVSEDSFSSCLDEKNPFIPPTKKNFHFCEVLGPPFRHCSYINPLISN